LLQLLLALAIVLLGAVGPRVEMGSPSPRQIEIVILAAVLVAFLSASHIGQFDPILSIELALAAGRIRPGALIVMASAGVSYAWGAYALRWGKRSASEVALRD
jgi:hypothetical protein